MFIGHLTNFVVSLLNDVMIRCGMDAVAHYLRIGTDVFLYVYPMLLATYYMGLYIDLIMCFDTPYSCWLFLEVQIFTCWIISSFLFLFLSYTCKYRSYWQESVAKINRYVWHEKDVDDYMHYLRNEYMIFSLIVTFILVDYIHIGFILNFK